MRRRKILSFIITCCLLVLGIVVIKAPAQDQQDQTPPKGQNGMGMGALFAGLQNSPGCLGMEVGQFQSGKQTIFVWFEDKKACLAWYYNEAHQAMMDQLLSSEDKTRGHRKPLANLPDDVGPIMAIASITPAEQSQFEGVAMPISQIAIELYAPLPGGLFLGSRFAPKGVKVEDIRDYTPPTPATGE